MTPGLSHDYVTRTADRQAAFVLPYLRPGMNLLDIGCGSGSIMLGLAGAVVPGHVIGINNDREHFEAAKALAVERGITNVTLQLGDAPSLSFQEETFEAAFENNVFTYLAQEAPRAAREVYRVLKSQGFFAVRDVDADSVV